MENDQSYQKREFEKLLVALRYTDCGFLCFTTPSADGQELMMEKISNRIDSESPVFYDCALEKPFRGFSFINNLVSNNSAAKVFILYNFQHLALKVKEKDYDFFMALNFSRDPWANLQKLFVLGMTEDFERQIMIKAPDFYSFFLTAFRFDLSRPQDYAVQIREQYTEQPLPSQAVGRIARKRYQQLLEKVSQQGINFSQISSQTEQLFLDFLEAWTEYNQISFAKSSAILLVILDTLQKKAPNWPSSLATAYNYEIIAFACFKLRHFEDAENWYQKALEIRLKQGNEQGAASTYHQLGRVAEERRDFDSAEELYQKSLTIELEQDNEQGAASTYHQLGMLAQKRRDLDSAEEWYQKSLTIELKQGNEYGAAQTYNQLGSVAEERRNFDSAEDCYQKALAIELKQGNEYGAAKTYHQLGMLAQKLRDFDSAEDWYQKTLAINIEQGNEYGAARTYHQLGILAHERRDFETAEGCYQKALVINIEQGNEYGTAVTYHQLGILAHERQDFETAEDFYQKALAVFRQMNDPYNADIARRNLARLQELKEGKQ
ncbi:MAG: tetratricopeptide repeat protein [Clostridiales bacterium]|jgi:tetratricopeptide (TPR) repeat protein|nr:tetratricopeptide repeat protein [Clostridiales bacterium]